MPTDLPRRLAPGFEAGGLLSRDDEDREVIGGMRVALLATFGPWLFCLVVGLLYVFGVGV